MQSKKFLHFAKSGAPLASACLIAILPSCALKNLSDKGNAESAAVSVDAFEDALAVLDDAIEETAPSSQVKPSSLDVPLESDEQLNIPDDTLVIEEIETPEMDTVTTDTLFALADDGSVDEAAAAPSPAAPEEIVPVKREHVVVKRPSPSYSQLAQTTYAVDEFRKVRTTAYCHTEDDHIKYGELSAAGKPLRFGMVRSAAADWSRYPVGTRFRIVGKPYEYVIDDYGSALVGTDTIDLYKPSDDRMDDWGVREVEIEVIAWGSFEKSVEILDPRKEMGDHIKQMIGAIKNQPEGSAFAGNSNDPSIEP